MNRDKINGYGTIFRFITPTLVTIALFILGMLRTDMIAAKIETKENFNKLEAIAKVNFDNMNLQFSNHLSTHRTFDKEVCERLSSIEAIIK